MKKQLETSSASVNGNGINASLQHDIESITNVFNVNLDNINDDECEIQRRLNDNNSTVANLIFDNDNDNGGCGINDNTQYFIDSQFDVPDASTKTTSSSTNLRLNDTDNTSWWLNSIPYDEAAGDQATLVFNGANMKNKLRHIDSGELPWWLTETDDVTMADDITLNQSETEPDVSLVEGGSEWLANTSGGAGAGAAGVDNVWQMHNDDNTMYLSPSIEAKLAEPTAPLYKISHIKSGERAWWMDDNNNTVNSDSKDELPYVADVELANSVAPHSLAIETDERSSYMMSSDDSRWKYPIKYVNMQDQDLEQPWWMKTEESSEVAPPIIENRQSVKSPFNPINNIEYDPMPLGDRASPEGLEDLHSKHRLSASYSFPVANEPSAPKNIKKLYISRFENVDDLLGGSCHTLSPMLLDRFSGDVFEEITPAQVRIHDSTPKFIHRMTDEK